MGDSLERAGYLALAGLATRLANDLEEPGAVTRPGFSMGSRRGSFFIGMGEVLAQHRRNRLVAIGEAAGGLELIKLIDQVVRNDALQLRKSSLSRLGASLALVDRVVVGIVRTRHDRPIRARFHPAVN